MIVRLGETGAAGGGSAAGGGGASVGGGSGGGALVELASLASGASDFVVSSGSGFPGPFGVSAILTSLGC